MTAAERDLALSGWQADYDATARAFERSTGTRYRHQPGTLPTEPERLRRSANWWADLQKKMGRQQEQTAERAAKAAKLADAVASQASFVGRVLALGPRIITDDWIDIGHREVDGDWSPGRPPSRESTNACYEATARTQ